MPEQVEILYRWKPIHVRVGRSSSCMKDSLTKSEVVEERVGEQPEDWLVEEKKGKNGKNKQNLGNM